MAQIESTWQTYYASRLCHSSSYHTIFPQKKKFAKQASKHEQNTRQAGSAMLMLAIGTIHDLQRLGFG